MDGTSDDAADIVVVACRAGLATGVRATVRSLLAAAGPRCLVVDVDGDYRPIGSEEVVRLADLVHGPGSLEEALRAAATLDPADLQLYAALVGAEHALAGGARTALLVRAGVHLLRDPTPLLADGVGVLAVPGTDVTGVVRRMAASRPAVREMVHDGRSAVVGPGAGPQLSRALLVLGSLGHATALRALAADWRTAAEALDLYVADAGGMVVRDRIVLVTPWRGLPATGLDAAGLLTAGPFTPYALDLSELDPDRPWLLDAGATVTPRVSLADQPVLARIVEAEANRRRADVAGPEGPPAGPRLDAALRAEARRVEAAGGRLPDVLGTGQEPGLEEWALELVPPGDRRPVARYLAAVRSARPALQRMVRGVPGPGSQALAAWAEKQGPGDHDLELLGRAAARTRAAQEPGPEAGPDEPGVNLVGYLSGELGIGTSVRLVDEALQAAGVPTSTVDVGGSIGSRRGADFRRSAQVRRRTTVLCVNAREVRSVARRRPDLVTGLRVVGMWYWELEDFPASQHGGFAHVDEVWVATDFMRAAIEPHAGDVPVRTVTPPLPQAGPAPGAVPDRFGIPTERPWFLFTFDYFSVAERKNPRGLVAAFTRAFGHRPEAERPTLVIKTINGDQHPVEAERLRLEVAGRSDVLLLDTYLDDAERHVLVAHCTAYVSLHRAEGLGLTVAEAMAWGRPVITTGYGGVTQFCTDDNAFLVDWTPTRIAETAGPYEQGATWAEPDLDHAARLMRAVVDDPEAASTVGARAARDIRERHDATAAGARMKEVLREGDERWSSAGAASSGVGPVEQAPPARPGIVGRLRSAKARLDRG